MARPRVAARWWQQRRLRRPTSGKPGPPAGWRLSSLPPFAPVAPPATLQISSTASFKAPSAVAKPLQAAFRRTPLRIQAARIGGVEVPNQK